MKKSVKLSFSIIAHNEERHIKRCLESIKWADEIIIVDCESTDDTVKIAKKYTNKIYKRKNNPNLNINKSFGISKATGDWIFYIDPDEEITPELKSEILYVIKKKNNEFSAFKIPRLNYYVFGFLKYGGNYPDHQIRLFKKDKAYFPKKHVHERLIVKGKIGKLKSPMKHYPYLSITEYINKLNFYTDFQANYWLKNGKQLSKSILIYNITFVAMKKFIERYILKAGFLDGIAGLFAAFSHSITYIISYLKLYEKFDKKS